MTRDQIYRVVRGQVGMPPDVLWRAGRALHQLGVWWMSGPLALALEPRYDAHLIGAVGELVLEPMHFLWRGSLYDFLRYRAEFREYSDFGLRCIKEAGTLPSPLQDLFEPAWQRWYAFDATELETKEHEDHFFESAPALARAISLLRAQQRDRDSDSYEPSYRVLLHDVNKDIREYFEIGGYRQQPRYFRKKYPIESTPRFNLLSNDEFRQTEFGKRMQALFAPKASRATASDVYRNGWDLSVPCASGFLGLALLDYEREYYLLIAQIAKSLVPILEREGKQTKSDTEQLRRYKTWWRSLWAISCLIGPLDEPLSFLSEEIDTLVLEHVEKSGNDTIKPMLLKVPDLHEAFFSDGDVGAQLRKMVTIPDDMAKELSRYTIGSTYDPSDYDSSTTHSAMATVLDMLHSKEFGYPPGHVRTELFWWFRDVAHRLDEVD